jgi:hypothetical protein
MPETSTVEGRTLQLAMAFGQGAGVMLATEAALLAALGPYAESIRGRDSDWDEYALQSLEYARVLGSLAAHHALGAGHCVIDAHDVRHALEIVRENRLPPLLVCKLTLPGRY